MTPDEIIANTLSHEGGYVNHPNDPGGHTKYGITLNTYKRYYPEATPNTIKNLTKEQAVAFYKVNIYDKFNIDASPSALRDILFDMVVNHGIGNASKILQRGLNARGCNIKVDGRIGKKTLAAAKEAVRDDVQETREAVNDCRQQFYNRLVANRPAMKVFAKGWRNRVNSFRV